MLDITEIEATVGAMILKPTDDNVDSFVNGYIELEQKLKDFSEIALGYYHHNAKKKLKTKWDEYCRAIGVSESKIRKQVALYKASLEVDIPKEVTAPKYAELKGNTPEEKIAKYESIKEAIGKPPTVKEIKENFKKQSTLTVSETNLKQNEVVQDIKKIDYKELYEATLKELEECKKLNEELKTKLKKEVELKKRRNAEIKQLKAKTMLDFDAVAEALFEIGEHISFLNKFKYAPKKPEKCFGDALKVLNIKVLPKDTKEAIKLVKRSYKSLAKQYHPDKGGDEDSFNRIREAMNKIIEELNYE